MREIPERPAGWQRLRKAFGYSLAGLATAFRNEPAFRQIVALNALLIPSSFFLPVSAFERTLLIVVCLFAVVVELINSAIEAAIDRISVEFHPLSKNAKDMGSAAQLIALVMIIVTWVGVLV